MLLKTEGWLGWFCSMWTVRALIYIFSEVCARRTDLVRYSPARCSDALISGALLRCPNIATVGAAYVWSTPGGWTGRRYHLGTNKEVLDAETFAIY